ncbi:hypothetical protein L3X38_027061 [Prunus dulcis]|uniref:Uncharacterized protein n=1 Tax=Prunus dulcis TaxID=3755 RepID=A0AAD4VM77_PRUDU|nr:hypothetical protein L3X38_027061 [Prunus dulcis]
MATSSTTLFHRRVLTIGRLEDATSRQAIRAKSTGRLEGDDRSPNTMHDDCVKTSICAKSTGRPEGDDRSPVEFLDEICPLPVECNSDIGDSCEDEIDIRPPLPCQCPNQLVMMMRAKSLSRVPLYDPIMKMPTMR